MYHLHTVVLGNHCYIAVELVESVGSEIGLDLPYSVKDLKLAHIGVGIMIPLSYSSTMKDFPGVRITGVSDPRGEGVNRVANRFLS